MRFLTLAVVSTIAFASTAVSAQGADAEAIAAAQFDRGLAAMTAGELDDACPALAESYRLAPKPGALFTLAECEAKWGRVASADRHYAEYLAWFSRMTPEERRLQIGREKISEQAREDLKPLLPRLTVHVSTPLPPNAVVKRDGVVLGVPSLDVPLPVDPGVHVVVLELPDGRTTQQAVTIQRGTSEQLTLDLPVVEPAPAEPKVDATSPKPLLVRVAPYAAAGVGVLGIGIGTSFGLVAMSRTSTIAEHCQGNVCDREGVAAADSAQTAAAVSTVGFCVGIVGLAAGAVMYFWKPRGAPWVAAGPGGIGGVF